MDKTISKLTITYTDGTQAHYTQPNLDNLSIVKNYNPGITIDRIMQIINSFYVKNNIYRSYDVEELEQYLIFNFGSIKSEHLGSFRKGKESET